MHMKKQNSIHRTRWLCLLGLVILAGLFLSWWSVHPDTSAAGRLSACGSAALFAGMGIASIRGWMARWDTPPAPSCGQPVRKKQVLGVFLALLAFEGGVILLIFVLQVMNGCRDSLPEALELWTKTDSQHYLDIAQDWYLAEGERGRVVQLVFLPGYPLAIRLFRLMTGEYLYAGLLVSALSFAGGGSLLYCLARLDGNHDRALRAVKYTCLMPGAFFFAAPMSESLFFLLSLACVYCGRKGRFLPAGLLGGMAAFTRSLGLALLVPVCFDYIDRFVITRRRFAGKDIPRALCLLLIPLGFLAYCGVCKSISGEWFKFLEYQRDHWYQSLGLFFSTASYQAEYAVSYFRALDYEGMMGIWIPNLLCSFLSLGIMALTARKLHPGYIAYYVIAIGATWLLSAPRYLIVLFPVCMGLAELTENRRADSAATILLTLLSLLYAFMFVWRWQVW